MDAKIRSNDEAKKLELMGIEVRVRASASDTTGAISALEQRVAPGKGSPLHTTAQDKIILVLDGRVAVTIGDGEHEQAAGGVAFIPRGTPHCFTNRSEDPARILVLMTPGGHESFLEDASRVTPRTPAFAEVCARHHVTLVPR